MRQVRRWANWAGTQRCRPAAVAAPVDVEGIQALLTRAGRDGTVVRPAGSGHSFTPLVVTDGVVLSPRGLRGPVELDSASGVVRVPAGTTLHALSAELERAGRALAVLGDIDTQTIAGATQTGTHGTGRQVASLAAQVRALELVLPGGDLVTCSADTDPELFAAARVGLGALGVVTAVHVATVPAFRLRGTTERARLSAVAEDLGAFAASSDHSELFWLPRTDTVQLKRRDRVPDPPSSRWRRATRAVEVDLVENAGLAALGAAHRAAPRAIGPANRVAAALIGRSAVVDSSAAVFASPRRVRFVEMEYALPASAGRAVLTELRRVLARHETGFPVEVRFAPGDDVWLSPATGRDTVFVAVHAFRRAPAPEFFVDAEAVFTGYGGRPHWGKVHSLTGAALAAAYPRLDRWRAVRDRVDPRRLLTSPYLAELLGD